MSEYVTNESWVRVLGRPDTVDDIADQFERRTPMPSLPVEHVRELARPGAVARWPHSGRGWRSVGRLHRQPADERSTSA